MSKISLSRFIPWLAAMVPIGLSACNQYEMFLVTGEEQVAFNGKVDVLFVIDNSKSLTEEASELLSNFDTFIDGLAGEGSYGKQTENLTDAVRDYITFTSNRAEAIDYNLAVMTHDMMTKGTADPGEVGLFVGDDPVISRADADGRLRFLQHIGCWSTCWVGGDVDSEGSFTCVAGDPDLEFPSNGRVNSQYLDCLCKDLDYGASQNGGVPFHDSPGWNQGTVCHGDAEAAGAGDGGVTAKADVHLEASLIGMCRSVENPPEVCWHNGSVLDEPENGSADWIMSNKDWLRPDSKVVIIIITDTNDNSTTANDGLHNSDFDHWDPTPYLRAFEAFDRPITFAVIGPDLQCEGGDCTGIVCKDPAEKPQTGPTERLRNMALATGGFYRPITEGDDPSNRDPGCSISNFSEHLDELGKLMINLQTVFKLRAVPEESSIRVYVDDETITKAEPLTSGAGDNTVTFGDAYDDGWSYDPGENAVVFWGDTIPDFNQDVEIFYRPLDGNPRELPL